MQVEVVKGRIAHETAAQVRLEAEPRAERTCRANAEATGELRRRAEQELRYRISTPDCAFASSNFRKVSGRAQPQPDHSGCADRTSSCRVVSSRRSGSRFRAARVRSFSSYSCSAFRATVLAARLTGFLACVSRKLQSTDNPPGCERATVDGGRVPPALWVAGIVQ